MKLLLDTCTFLWMISAEDRLSPAARDALENPTHTLYLHQASAWEIQIKHQKGSLTLSESPKYLIRQGLKLHDIAYLKLEDAAIWHLKKLPEHHKDPFDRVLISTALTEGMKMVTPDPKIHQYPLALIW